MLQGTFRPSAVALMAVVISCGSVQAMPITTGTAPPPTLQTSPMNHVQLAQWGHRYYWHGNHGWRRAHWRQGWYGGAGWRHNYYIAPAGYAYGPNNWHEDHWHNDANFILPGLILLGAGIGLGAIIF